MKKIFEKGPEPTKDKVKEILHVFSQQKSFTFIKDNVDNHNDVDLYNWNISTIHGLIYTNKGIISITDRFYLEDEFKILKKVKTTNFRLIELFLSSDVADRELVVEILETL